MPQTPLGTRSQALPYVTTAALGARLGEWHLIPADGRKTWIGCLAHHLLQARGHWATSRQMPYAHLFFDISSAFYSVLRQSLFPGEDPPSSLIAALHRFQVKDTNIDYMLNAVYSDDATAGIDEHFKRLLKDALANTQFFISGLDAPCRTNRGTRPGDPMGDLLYNMVMSLVMQDTRSRLRGTIEVAWIGTPEVRAPFAVVDAVPREAFFDLAFVDDCASPSMRPTFAVSSRSCKLLCMRWTLLQKDEGCFSITLPARLKSCCIWLVVVLPLPSTSSLRMATSCSGEKMTSPTS